MIKPAAKVNAAIGTDVAAARFQSIVMRFEVCKMATYFIEPGDWESATGESLPSESDGIAVVPVSDLRKAIEPVLSWFDVDGEEGEPMDVVSVIGEIATYLEEDRRDLLLYRKALRAILTSRDLAMAKAIARDAVERHVESA